MNQNRVFWNALCLLGFALAACNAANPAENEIQTEPAPTPTASASPQVQPTFTFAPPPTAEVTSEPAPTSPPTQSANLMFDGSAAFRFLEDQMTFGPRYPGSEGHLLVQAYIREQLEGMNWRVEEQLFEYQGVALRNLVGVANEGVGEVIIVAAHYDTRKTADQTPNGRELGLAVPGAVDGASGVAVLLELARTLELEKVPREIWLVFFDGEDNGDGGIENWDWIVGSSYMADNLTVRPEAMVLVDLIGDAEQQLYYEGNSDAALRETLWQIGAQLGYGRSFIPEQKYTMIDDHVPFANKGIPSVDIIDFDYPYWHTVEDTADKASPESLESVGRTLEYWMEAHLE